MKTMTRRTFLASTASIAASTSLTSLPSLPTSLALPPPVSSASMWTYLWDLADEGWTTPLQLMKENGLTHVSLAAAYHAGRFLLPHNPRRKVYFLEDGTVYFTPNLARYERVKPKINLFVKDGEDFAKLVRSSAREGMGANAWVVCCHNTSLGEEYPDIACVNVFGDTMFHSLCPSNPDVRHYLKAIVEDLASQGASRIELEAMQFMGYPHGAHHEKNGIDLSEALTFLLGICFCRSCFTRSKNFVNLVPLQRYIRTTLENSFAAPEETNHLQSIEDLPHDMMSPFLEWRTSVVSSLAAELQEGVSGSETVLRPLVSGSKTSRTMAGVDVGRIAGITGGVLMPGYVRDGTMLRTPLKTMQKFVGEKNLVVGFQVGLPGSGGRSGFLSRMKTAREMGLQDFNFYNYGLIPLRNLGWIHDSVG